MLRKAETAFIVLAAAIILGLGTSIVVGIGNPSISASSTLPAPGTSGNVLTSNGTIWTSAAAAGGGGDTFTKATLAADFDKTNSTLADVTGFSFSIAANEKWTCEYLLFMEGGPGGVEIAITGPASPTTVRYAPDGSSGITSEDDGGYSAQAFEEILSAAGLAGVRVMVRVELCVQNGANAGTVQFQFAEDSTNVTKSTLLAGSMMIAHKVSP